MSRFGLAPAALDAHDQKRNLRRIGIGEHLVSGRHSDILATYGLGSCVAVLIFDATRKVAGMIHCMLPISAENKDRSHSRPSLFVDTGLPLLVSGMEKRGCKRENLRARLCGGGALKLMKDFFSIGSRNTSIARAVLETLEIPVSLEDVGGARSRTVFLQVGTGSAIIKSLGQTSPF